MIQQVLQKKVTFVRNLDALKARGRRSVVSIGSFDGVHLGHQSVLTSVLKSARENNLTSIVTTFEPQPKEYFGDERAPARLMRLREKIESLLAFGVDRVVCLRFNRELRNLSASEFIERVLSRGLGVKHLIIGDDFRFGCDRSGDIFMLRDFSARYSYKVEDTETLQVNGERISSTLVRKLIESSDFIKAKQLLGRAFAITGRVVHGQHLGRTLGFPTANVHLHRNRAPLSGVFAVRVYVGDRKYFGAANVGVRPTIGDAVKPILEVHLLDFSGDLYTQFITVEFLHKVREERKFDGLEELVSRITRDVRAIRNSLHYEQL